MMTKKCTSSVDCGEDYVCIEGVCHSCFNCGLLFREGPSCVIDFKQCGSCLKGYKDFPVTDFSTVIKPCEKTESKIHSQECINDQQCPFDNYCHEKTCVKCFDCSLYNRLPPNQNCAKDPQDCSSCLNGFYEVPVTTQTNTKPCQKLTSHSVQNVSVMQFLGSSYNIAWIFLGVFEIFMIVVILMFRRQAARSKQVIEVQCHSPRPPPYPSGVCQYVRGPEPEVEEEEEEECPPYSSGIRQYVHGPEPEVEEESSFFTYIQEEKEQQNTAKIFKLPHASYYYGSQEDIETLFGNYLEDEEEDVNSNAVDHGNERLLNNDTETDSVATYAQEEYDFEVVSDPEINMETVSDGNMIESNPIINGVEDGSPTVEECKNPNEGGGVEKGEKNDLTE